LSVLCSYITPERPRAPLIIDKIELCRKLGFTDVTGYYRNLKNSLLRLQSFAFNISETAPVNVHAINLFEHTNNKRESFVTIDFSESFYRLATDVNKGTDGFSRVQISEVLKLDKGTSKRIYLLISNFNRNGETFFTPEELREKLGFTGKYKDNTNFLKRVLIPAVNELIYSDRPIKITPVLRGKRSIIGYKFAFIERKPEQATNPNAGLGEEGKNQLKGYIKGRLHLNENQAALLIKRAPVSEIVRLGRIIETAIAESRNGKRANKILPEKYASYTASVFRKNFPPSVGDLFAAVYVPFVPVNVAA
jgi:plasmid replication initiation protein